MKAGDPIFKLDSSRQQAALQTAQRRVAETDAAFELAKTELAGADAKIQEAESAYQQAVDELATKTELQRRNASTVSEREIERLQNVVNGRQASVAATIASKQSVQAQISSLLPAQKASAEAALAEAQVELDKTVVRAGVDGRLEQFTLRKGDIVNPLMRSAGVLIPTEAGRVGLLAGFSQLEAQVMKTGMVAEVTCISKPLTIIPMVVTSVQDLIAAGQVQASDRLIDPQQVVRPARSPSIWSRFSRAVSTTCRPAAAASPTPTPTTTTGYDDPDLGTGQWVFLHVIDTVGVVHAIILRIQALLLPIQTLVLSGGH